MDRKLRERLGLILGLISFTVVFSWSLFNIGLVGPWIQGFLKIFSPFIIGGALAFILNLPMAYLERKLLKKLGGKYRRILSFVLTLLILGSVLVFTVLIIVPEVKKTLVDLSQKLPFLVGEIEDFLEANFSDPKTLDLLAKIDLSSGKIKEDFFNFLGKNALDWLNSTFYLASSLLGNIISLVVAFVFSIYLLFQKEELKVQVEKLVVAYFSEDRAQRIFYIGKLSSRTFAKFFSGQLLEALIIGLMFLIAMIIFRFPYALAISLTIGLMSLIPIVGSFIGFGLGFLMIMVISLKKALFFALLFIVLQQIEGNLIYPKVVGEASGLPSIWVLVAVSLGGSLMGILGIVIFIPLGAIGYSLLREDVNRRLVNKNLGPK